MTLKQGLLLLTVALGFAATLLGQSANRKNEKMLYSSKNNAERLWEMAIQAKGGRDRLHRIKNMVVSSEGSFNKGRVKIRARLEDLYILPNKWWSWDDQRPSVFGLSMSMKNWDTGKQYTVDIEGKPFRGLKELEEGGEGGKSFPGLIYLLLETDSDKVIPESVVAEKVKGKKVYICKVRLIGGK